MKCEFCGKKLSEGEVSCPYCGSLVRNMMSDRSNTVISIEQQNDIGNYKMSSNYKSPEEEKNEEDLFFDVDISRQKFAAQKFTSESTINRNVRNGDVVLREHGENIGNSLTYTNTVSFKKGKSDTSNKTKEFENKVISLEKQREIGRTENVVLRDNRLFNSNTSTYTMKKYSSVQSTAHSKVDLKKKHSFF